MEITFLYYARIGPVIDKPPPFKGINIRIPSILPTKGRGLIKQGSTLPKL